MTRGTIKNHKYSLNIFVLKQKQNLGRRFGISKELTNST